MIDSRKNRVNEARGEFAEALKMYRELAQKEPGTYLPSVPMTLNNLGLLDDAQNRWDDARKEAEEALEIYRDLSYTCDIANYLGGGSTPFLYLETSVDQRQSKCVVITRRCGVQCPERGAEHTLSGGAPDFGSGQQSVHSVHERRREAVGWIERCRNVPGYAKPPNQHCAPITIVAIFWIAEACRFLVPPSPNGCSP